MAVVAVKVDTVVLLLEQELLKMKTSHDLPLLDSSSGTVAKTGASRAIIDQKTRRFVLNLDAS